MRTATILFLSLTCTALLACGPNDDSHAPPDAGPATDTSLPPDAGSESDTSPPPATELIILHTNDLHDHLMGFGPNADYTPGSAGDDKTLGGFARLAARVEQQRAAAGNTPVLLLDAGDFMMGSLFSWLALDKAPVLTLMQALGYDAVTVGNHELDWTPDGLAGTFAAAMKHGYQVPVVASNMVFSTADSGDDGLEQLAAAGLIRHRLVKTLPNGLKVGIFGLMGEGAGRDAALAAPLTFDKPADVARKMVQTLRQQDKVDVVICLSHSGVGADGKGEDVDLAKEVAGIDVIVSGHTHVALHKHLTVGKTVIVQAGEHGQYLGRLKLSVRNNQVEVKESGLLAVDDVLAGSPAVQSKIDGFIGDLDGLLKPAGMSYQQVLAETDFDLTANELQESPLGNLVADAYRETITALQPQEPLLMAFEANGIIGDALRAGSSGSLWLADVYRALPLGIGPDQQPGYPLVTFYLTGAELKQGLELTANAADVLASDDFFLQVSGVTVAFDGKRPPFDRITSVQRLDGTAIDLTDTTACHRVGTNYYLASMLSMVKDVTAGALQITPREKDCVTPIADISKQIVDRDPATANLQELKQWQALVQYLSMLPDSDGDGIPNLPTTYAQTQGRIVAK